VPTPLAPPQGSGAARSSQSNQLPPVAGFYTGKPYLAESGSYAFKYREYNPEMNRWTTVDPSGFPDGANNRVYASAPTSELDNNGLNIIYTGTNSSLVADATAWNAVENSSYASGFGLISTSMNKAESGASWINDGSLNEAVQYSNLYTTVVDPQINSWLHSNISANGNKGVNMSAISNDPSQPGHEDFGNADFQLSWALHGVLFSVTGNVTDYNSSSGWQYDATVSYSKQWTFGIHATDNPISVPNAIGLALENANLISPYPVAGSFKSEFFE